ncbi:hypothetical protein O181_028302 [Austropuccinia psidii MF-1]|uniref:CN hydrolase domain-containing protein n=1 Tax=Austropuccinia psidii MF-1 TaxID=1389203 RepID=A0A9Q3CRM1_9BASI|nr:hypothetical protein [Austropuccinia psidii MF-1]
MVLAAVAQLCSRADIMENLVRCQSIIRRASAQGAKMIFLPEASDFIADPSCYPSLSTTLDKSKFVQGIQSSARQYQCWVSVGVHEKNSEGSKKCFNTSLIISDQGLIEQAYRKIHLFDIDLNKDTAANESQSISPGKELLKPLSTPIGIIGQLICYDVRFPEPALIHRLRNAHVLSYPSAFTVRTGAAHWQTLLRARAIETQCYVIAAAQVGVHMDHPVRQSWGHAMIIDPWGTILAQAPDLPPPKVENEEWGTNISLADINLDTLNSLRLSMPVFNQRRNDIYPRLD